MTAVLLVGVFLLACVLGAVALAIALWAVLLAVGRDLLDVFEGRE